MLLICTDLCHSIEINGNFIGKSSIHNHFAFRNLFNRTFKNTAIIEQYLIRCEAGGSEKKNGGYSGAQSTLKHDFSVFD
jgi:hypothetical protein